MGQLIYIGSGLSACINPRIIRKRPPVSMIPLKTIGMVELLNLTGVNHFEVLLLTWAVDVEFPRQI